MLPQSFFLFLFGSPSRGCTGNFYLVGLYISVINLCHTLLHFPNVVEIRPVRRRKKGASYRRLLRRLYIVNAVLEASGRQARFEMPPCCDEGLVGPLGVQLPPTEGFPQPHYQFSERRCLLVLLCSLKY